MTARVTPVEREAFNDICKKLYAEGLSCKQIATRLGRNTQSVQWSLDLDGYRDRARGNARRYRQRRKLIPDGPVERSNRIHDVVGCYRLGGRSIKKVIAPPEDRMAAARAFAAGEIDRAELMRRVTYHA